MTTWKLKTQLLCGALVTTLLVAVVAGVGFRSTGTLTHHVEDLGREVLPSVKLFLQVAREVETTKAAQRALLSPTLSSADRNHQLAIAAGAVKNIRAVMLQLDAIHQGIDREHLDAIAAALERWEPLNGKVTELATALIAGEVTDPVQMESWQEGFRSDHYAAMVKAASQIEHGQAYSGGADHMACRFGKWLGSYTTRNPAISGVMTNASTPHEQFHAAVGDIQAALTSGNTAQARAALEQHMRPAGEKVIAQFTAILAESAKARQRYDELQRTVMVDAKEREAALDAALTRAIDLELKSSDESVIDAESASALARTLMAVVALVGTLGALAAGAWFGTRISRRLDTVASTLGSGAEETAAAAAQVASASQALAAGASEQASSLEETSASLIELGATTRRNAESANDAKAAAASARSAADAGAAQMARMTEAMSAIERASSEITHTLKTIDEIAFQTNILALNAAVEAARAGEAGAGFAVVADEVRALAQRAASAARETDERITLAVTRSHEGVRVSSEVSTQLKQIQEQIHKLDALVSDIASASVEQRTGIEQLSSAVTQMDQITQANASSAEEIASTSEELNSQVSSLKQQTDTLNFVVHGRSGSNFPAEGKAAGAWSGEQSAPNDTDAPSGPPRLRRPRPVAVTEARRHSLDFSVR